jgi:flagellar biosynthetic protein FlhB
MSMEDRTEPATAKRREEARQRGEVAKSPELTSALVLLAGLYGLRYCGESLMNGLRDLTQTSLSNLSAFQATELGVRTLFTGLLIKTTTLMTPVMLVLSAMAVVASAAQVGLILSSKPLSPDLSRIDPLKGLQRLCSMRSLVELGKSLLKVLLVGYVLRKVLIGALPQLQDLQNADFVTSLGVAGSIAWDMARQTAIMLVIVGAVDYVVQRRQHEARLRMTKQEVKQEAKEQEGDPQIKGKIRQRQREMARGRMMQAVPSATAVVTNPTHIAVALSYDGGKMAAPKVVAKGQGLVAQRIKEIAQEHRVPIIENKPLARGLYKEVEIGDSVPPDLYKAVAEVLAFVYKLSGKVPQGMRSARARA